MNKQSTLITGTLLAGLAVALGAFGSHGLKDFLMRAGRTETFETAVRYQMYHALAMLLVGILMTAENKKTSKAAGFFFVGTILFSGSLYMLSLMPFAGVAYLTPIGGVMFMLGWILLLLHFLQKD